MYLVIAKWDACIDESGVEDRIAQLVSQGELLFSETEVFRVSARPDRDSSVTEGFNVPEFAVRVLGRGPQYESRRADIVPSRDRSFDHFREGSRAFEDTESNDE